MIATVTSKNVTRDRLPRTASHTMEKSPTKTPSRTGFLYALLRALSSFGA